MWCVFTSFKPLETDLSLQRSKDLDPVAVLEEFEFPGCPSSSFFLLANRLLSIVANSATCERLFSVFGTTLTKLRNRLGTTTLSSLAELKMHIRSEHQEKSTKNRMKHLFDHRSKTVPPSTTSLLQPRPFNPNPREAALDAEDPIPSIPDTSTPSLRHLIPNETVDDGASLAGRNGSVTLENLFNFNSSHWVNVHDESVSGHLTDELELCELLNRDAATGEGAEVDVDEMTGDILTS